MNWDAFTPWSALIGGVLIGFATALVLLLNGKIAGISGVLGRILRPKSGDILWRVYFVIGLIGGGAAVFGSYAPSNEMDFSAVHGWSSLLVGGLLVGLGTRLGGGCTSGHGVCGISRGSSGGIAATITFMTIAGLVVFLQNIALELLR